MPPVAHHQANQIGPASPLLDIHRNGGMIRAAIATIDQGNIMTGQCPISTLWRRCSSVRSRPVFSDISISQTRTASGSCQATRAGQVAVIAAKASRPGASINRRRPGPSRRDWIR